MKKLRLDLDDLDVVSFATRDEQAAVKGTIHGQDQIQTNSFFTLGGHDSCYGMCNTMEYDTCHEAGPTVGTSCDYFCTAPSIGCTPPAETEYCA
jgi:hypothetical protein